MRINASVSRLLFIFIFFCVLFKFFPTVIVTGTEQDMKSERGVSIKTQIKNDDNIKWYEDKLKEWQFQARILRVLQTVLAAIAILSSVYAASKLKKPEKLPEGLILFVAAISIALLTGLDLNTQANKLRTAWRTLNVAVREYKESEQKDITEVREAYARAEDAIGEYRPGPK